MTTVTFPQFNTKTDRNLETCHGKGRSIVVGNVPQPEKALGEISENDNDMTSYKA